MTGKPHARADHAKSGRRKKISKWLSANAVIATALVWITAFIFRSRLYELVGTAFWFPPEWRKMSIFLLVVIGSTTFAIGRKRMKIRRMMLKHGDLPSDPVREARRTMRWATAFGVAFLVLTCVYALLWYRCVIQFDHELDPDDDAKPAAHASHDEQAAEDAGEAAWPKSKYVYVPLFRPKKRIGDYDPALDNWHDAFSNDYQGVHDKLYAEYAFSIGATTVIFLNVYAAMVIALAGAFVNTFSAKEFLGEATVEKVKSVIP